MASYEFIDHKYDVVVLGAGGSGLRVVIEDYVYTHLSKAACLLANLFVCGLFGALAVFSILKVALGGA